MIQTRRSAPAAARSAGSTPRAYCKSVPRARARGRVPPVMARAEHNRRSLTPISCWETRIRRVSWGAACRSTWRRRERRSRRSPIRSAFPSSGPRTECSRSSTATWSTRHPPRFRGAWLRSPRLRAGRSRRRHSRSHYVSRRRDGYRHNHPAEACVRALCVREIISDVKYNVHGDEPVAPRRRGLRNNQPAVRTD